MEELKKELFQRVLSAMENGRLIDVEFSSDGSCASFHIKSNVTEETYRITLGKEEAWACLRGHRLAKHHLFNCF